MKIAKDALSTKLRLVYEKCAKKRSKQLEKSSNKVVCRRPTSGAPKFAVGMMVKNKDDDQSSGVILSWDLHCTESNEWVEKNGFRNLTRGVEQPFYDVLDDNGGKYYEAEGNGTKSSFRL